MISQRKEFFISLLLIALIIPGAIAHYFLFMKEYQKAPVGMRTPQEYNAYLTRNHHFDSVILGSSMSMCFRCSEFDRVCNGFSYKLTIPGCEVPVWTAMARYICKYQNIKAVLADLHLELLLLPAANMKIIDEYYSDDKKIWTDIRAGASLKTLRERRLFYWKKLKKKQKKEVPFSRDDLYDWSKEFPCGKDVFARQIVRHPHKPDSNRKTAYVSKNLEPLIAFIRENPQIRFYLYLPPYSVFAHDDKELLPAARKIVMDLLIPFPNVELYDFQSADCITDFSQYKDLTHFSPAVSSWIIQQMKEKNYRVTKENRSVFEQKYMDTVLAFDQEKAIRELKEYYSSHKLEKKKRK